jgi:RecA-family ATPase
MNMIPRDILASTSVEDLSTFLELILPSQGYFCAAIKTAARKFTHRFASTHRELAEILLEADAKGLTAYHACASYKTSRRRIDEKGVPHWREATNVYLVKALWLDVDLTKKIPGGEIVQVYPDIKEASRALTTFSRSEGLPLPVIVYSGGGLQVYWPLQQELTREEWLLYARGLREAARERGLEFDPVRTCDAASILRPPGTHNRKYGEPRPVTCEPAAPSPLRAFAPSPLGAFASLRGRGLRATDRHASDEAETPSWLSDTPVPNYLEGLFVKGRDLTRVAMAGINLYPPSDPHLVADRCAQLRAMRDTGGCLIEPLWFANLGVLAFCTNGDEVAHEWSKGDERYWFDVTQDRLDRKREMSGPTTCEHFEGLDPKGCEGCPYRGEINSPISLGRPDEPLTEQAGASQGEASAGSSFLEPHEAEERLRKLGIVRVSGLAGMPIPRRRFLVPDWVPHGVVTGLYGDGGMGKSLLVMQLQTSMALGKPWLGLQICEPGISLGVYCEDARDELMRRQADINAHYGCGFEDVKEAHWWPRLGEDNMLMTFTSKGKAELTSFFRQVKEAALDLKAKLIIIDTVADTFGGDENDRGQVRQYVQGALGSLARDIGGYVVCTAHPSRVGLSTGSGDSGSTAWSNALRSRLYIERTKAAPGDPPDPHASTLYRKKANYAARDASINLRWHQGVIGPDTFLGTDQDRPSADEAFLKLLDKMAQEGRQVSSKSRAGNYAPKLFAKRPDRCGYGEAEFERAMERLFNSGAIAIGNYRRNGKDHERIVRGASPC